MFKFVEVTNDDEYYKLINSDLISVVFFSAPWAEQCNQVRDALSEISKLGYGNLQFVNIAAESFPEISIKHQIEAVPTIVFFSKGTALDRIDGVDIVAMTNLCKKFGKSGDPKQTLEERLKALINKADLMVFMKGSPDAPRCGFSKQLIGILNDMGLKYETFDILTDEEVRQGLKTYSDWPTYPQVYVKGELVGGLDIVKELLASGELRSSLGVS